MIGRKGKERQGKTRSVKGIEIMDFKNLFTKHNLN